MGERRQRLFVGGHAGPDMNSVAMSRLSGPGDFRGHEPDGYSSAGRPAGIMVRTEAGGSVRWAAVRSMSHRKGSPDPEVVTAGTRPVSVAPASDMGGHITSRMSIGGGALSGSGDIGTPPIVGDGSTGLGDTTAGSANARCGIPTPIDGSRATGASEADDADDRRARSALQDAAAGSPGATELAVRSTTNTLFRLAHQLASLAARLPKTSSQDAETALVGTIESLISCVYTLRPCPQVQDNGRQSAIRISVENYIERSLSSIDMSAEGISQALGIPRSTLYRAFTDVGGIVRYIQDRRLAAARSLLLHPEEHRSIGEIADSVGFTNASTFSRTFRRQFGCSPRDMRGRGIRIVEVMRRERHEVSPR